VVIDRKTHWDKVYSTPDETGLSWYQSAPRLSLDLIHSVAPGDRGRIIDVGGGTSVLVDWLLDLSFEKIAVLDVSDTALCKARARLGERAALVDWIAADITEAQTLGTFDVWHDRAVFHFLTDAEDRKRYVELARRTVRAGGHLVIASFADDGPSRCSDLDVCCYNADSMAREFRGVFSLVKQAGETHTTPSGCSQAFCYGVFRRR
jgi:SAM-dependent methyltransferase